MGGAVNRPVDYPMNQVVVTTVDRSANRAVDRGSEDDG